MKPQKILHTVSNFLFSRTNREFLIFLFFFAVAGIFWLMMTLNENYEQEFRVCVRYTDVPKTTVLTSPETDTVRVTLSDKGYVLISYVFGSMLDEIDADFRNYSRESGNGRIPQSELLRLISSRLSVSTKIISIKPDHLTFYYNYGEKKKVPVRWRGTVTPEAHYYLASVDYSHDSITVYASPEKLDSISTVFTEAIVNNGFRDTLRVNTQLRRMAGVKMVPDEVEVTFVADVLTEESIDDIPIQGINMPEGKMLRTFPAKVKINFVAGVKTLKSLSPDDFRVVADYNELRKNPSAKCRIYIEKVPEGISRATLEVKQVDYLIEETDE